MSRTAFAGAFAALRGLRAAVPPACELCAGPLGGDHGHVADAATRRARCVCAACAIVCDRATGRFRRVGERVVELAPPPAAAWDALGIPVGLAFIVVDDGLAVAYLPGPAGALEAPLAATAWAGLVAAQPELAALAPITEALLAHRLDGACRHLIAPIDRCWRLAATVRSAWRGVNGGDEVRRRVAESLATLGAGACSGNAA